MASHRRTLSDIDKADGFMYTLELKLEMITKTEKDKVLALLSGIPDVKMGKFTKIPIAPEQKTSI